MKLLILQGFAVLLMSVLVGGYIEVVEERGCHDAQFRLTCRNLDARIAVLEATYSSTNSTIVDFSCLLPTTPTSDDSSSSTGSGQLYYENSSGNNTSQLRLPRSTPTPEEAHIRLPVNHRCSGLNHCSFILTSDYKAAEDWGPGVVYIRYACMDMEHITRKCQEEILVEDEGFVQSPGYPQYNVGDSECHWGLHARPGQRVQLTLLDISLRGIGSMDTECKDKLQVKEGSRTLLSTCGEREEAIVLESEGSGLNVSVSIASRKLFPKRGVFFHYKALGCPPLPPPKDGYLVNHNETDAQYMCCVGFVFPDTFHRVKNLHCENGNRWHTSLTDCINVTFNKWQKNATLGGYPYSEMNITLYEMAAMRKESDFMYDILLPTMIISVLMIGNGVIIFVIFYLRKRRKLQQQADDEELGAIFQPHDGSVSDKAISV